MLLAELEKKKIAQTARPRRDADPRPGSRHVPAAIKREVWERDGGRCAFIGTDGRCSERGLLEFHHVVPFADGRETTIANLQLRCRAHNAYEADVHFGPLLLRETEALYQLGPDRAESWDQSRSGIVHGGRLDDVGVEKRVGDCVEAERNRERPQ